MAAAAITSGATTGPIEVRLRSVANDTENDRIFNTILERVLRQTLSVDEAISKIDSHIVNEAFSDLDAALQATNPLNGLSFEFESHMIYCGPNPRYALKSLYQAIYKAALRVPENHETQDVLVRLLVGLADLDRSVPQMRPRDRSGNSNFKDLYNGLHTHLELVQWLDALKSTDPPSPISSSAHRANQTLRVRIGLEYDPVRPTDAQTVKFRNGNAFLARCATAGVADSAPRMDRSVLRDLAKLHDYVGAHDYFSQPTTESSDASGTDVPEESRRSSSSSTRTALPPSPLRDDVDVDTCVIGAAMWIRHAAAYGYNLLLRGEEDLPSDVALYDTWSARVWTREMWGKWRDVFAFIADGGFSCGDEAKALASECLEVMKGVEKTKKSSPLVEVFSRPAFVLDAEEDELEDELDEMDED